MTDEPRPGEPGTEDAMTAQETATATEGGEGEAKAKLHQTVEIRDLGHCKKHIKVTVERQDIDARFGDKFSELVTDANVPGFRPGKAPRKVIERRFQREVGEQVKTEVLLASLEQLAEDHDIAPLASPNIDPKDIELPSHGPLVYEFEVEVRPQFDLPDYRGLKLRRPVHEFTADEKAEEERRLLAPYGQVIPKPEGNVQVGDVLVVDATIRAGERVIGNLKEEQFHVNRQLAFKDGIARHFAEQVKGANAGDVRTVDIELSDAVANESLRGKTVQATLEIKDVKTLRLPELTNEFLHNFGVHSPEQFHELMEVLLKRRMEYLQRQSAREQVLTQIADAANWDLPRDLLARQAHNAMARRVMEMRSEGISEDEIKSRMRLLQQNVLESTAVALKEHFVLQKIAEVEKIDINEDDINDEIERMAAQTDESPRRVRARLEKEDMLEALAVEMIERKVLDLILDSAEYVDVPLDAKAEPAVATVEAQAVPGEMTDPTAVPETPPEQSSSQT
jgi:trigger factor